MASITIDVNELPARFAEAVSIAERGDEVFITSPGQPTVKFIPEPRPSTKPRILGLDRGAAIIPPDFNDPLPEQFWMGDAK